MSRTGTTSGEPTLGVTKNGHIILSALQQTGAEVLKSTDEGRSWEVISPQLAESIAIHQVSLDPYVYVDDKNEDVQRIFTIDLTVACSYMSFSDDGGESWTTNPLACGRPVNDHQTLFAGPPASSPTVGYPNIVYYCWNDVATSSCSRSLDGGITFHPTGSPAFIGYETEGEASGHCGGIHGHGVVDDEGIVYLPREFCARPFLAISRDEGTTWERVRVSSLRAIRNGDPSVDVDSAGNIYYAWVGPKRLPFLAVSKDGGKSWSKPMMIGAPGVHEVNLLTLDVGAPGRVAFAYMGSKDAEHPKTWDGFMGMSVTALKASPIFYSAAVSRDEDPLKRGACGPARCGETILDFIDVVIAPDGSPWASFVDACDAKCIETEFESGNEGAVGHLVGGPALDR